MKPWMMKGALILLALAAGGFLVAASGVIPIKASSGHWPITAWFLHFSMRRSITTHSLTIKVPPLDDPALILKGAGHYETGCQPCHGSPESMKPPVFQAMTPPPPYLPPRIPAWDSEDLFYIVKHGVKFTGMPAWPTPKRDDEVWAMVAFLRQFPDLDAAGYRELVHGKASSTAQLERRVLPQEGHSPASIALHQCARCHGADGLGRGTGAFPRLAGQSPVYLQNALQAFARGERHSGLMQPLAARLEPKTIRELAVWYGGLGGTAQLPQDQATTESIERGKAIAENGIPDKRVASCVDCHGPNPKRRKPAYPLLAGQYADYLYLQLTLFKKEHRGSSEYAHLMKPIASRMTEEQMRDVALYYASLPWHGAAPRQ